MIAYLDTSALVKLYVDEPDSERVREAASEAKLTATHELSYVEARSAFARRWRLEDWAEYDYRRAIACLDDGWPALYRINVSVKLIRRAAHLTEHYALRAYDAVQLAAAQAVDEYVGDGASVRFGCFDEHLTSAAQQLGLQRL